MEPQNGVAVRLASLERAVHRLERLEPAVVKQQVEDLRQDVVELRHEIRETVQKVESKVDAQTKALYTAALSVAGGAVLFAFTAFQIWGGP